MLTPKDLTEALKIAFKTGETAASSTAGLRYAIYARKSTESEERQVRSLGDQVIECEQLAEKTGLKVLKVVKESESAKEPDIRPKFRALLDELSKGKLDGIIAWHPDRLARNMKDAGEVIDLLDKGIIKDLRFVSFSFENNTMGKMLLGVAFVMSKQYSDQLSDNVRRGIRRSLEEGKYLHRSKHGYVKDRNQLLRPDAENYALIKNAFHMRLEGKTLESIAQHLNESGYTRAPAMGGQRKVYKMDNKRVSEFLRDPVYTGVLLYGDSITDLTDIYDFLPMITVDEFKKLNRVSDINRAFRLTKRYHQPGVIKADLMRGMVICGECEEPMTACITSKKAKDGTIKYFYYRCDTFDCKNRGKSIRAKVVFDFLYDFLEKNRYTSREVYDHYAAEMQRIVKVRNADYETLLRSLGQTKRQQEERLEKTKALLLDEQDGEIRGHFKGDLNAIEQKVKDAAASIERVKADRERNNQAILTYGQFVELFGNIAERLRKVTAMADLDFIIRKFFLNFTIKDKKVASYTQNSPFGEFAGHGVIRDGRGDRD